MNRNKMNGNELIKKFTLKIKKNALKLKKKFIKKKKVSDYF